MNLPFPYGSVDTHSDLYKQECHEGDIIFCKEVEKYYVFHNNDFFEYKLDKLNSLNLYDLNKSIINQLTPLSKEEIESKKDLINSYLDESLNNYHMLLCKDFNYYTVFNKNILYIKSFSEIVIEIITELGKVYSIEKTEDNKALEIWIKPTEEESPYAFYLFPYDAGVVYYG